MKAEKIKPLGKNVLVKPLEVAKQTESGIYLPDTASEEKPQEGVVVAIGDSEKITVKKNQTIIYTRYSGTEFKVGEEDYLLVKNEDILAIVE